MDKLPANGIRVTVTRKPAFGVKAVNLLDEVKKAGLHVASAKSERIQGVIASDRLDELAAVPGIDIKINEDFQLSPVETEAT